MQYVDLMKKCEDYIEEHLEYPPTAKELADLTGYSLYHFCHIFRAHFGISVGEYISRRKLEKAAENIEDGMSITEASQRAGYDTPSGFAKAFKKAYGTSATVYKKKRNPKFADYYREEEIFMNTCFVKKEAFSALGYCIKPEKEDILIKENGAYWKNIDFKKLPKYPMDLEDCGEVAAWIHPDEKSGDLNYFFGFETEAETAPEGFALINIPEAEYAVFEVQVPATDEKLSDELKKLWKDIFDGWFDLSDKKFDEEKMCFEYYLGEKAYIYVPVK
ncbi:MAG: AraC family transcriptional regulator [Oscillospiraceae bacterium]|nr:AraC family transcriptional regulator [Oscillospiraceae bacterium]